MSKFDFLINDKGRNFPINIRNIFNYRYNPFTGKVINPSQRARKYEIELSFSASSQMPFYSFKKSDTNGYLKVYIDSIVKSIFPNEFPLQYVIHLDRNPFHNNIENLAPSNNPEVMDKHIIEKIANVETITEQDFIEHPLIIQDESSDNRKMCFVGNYKDTKTLWLDGIEHSYAYEHKSGKIVNNKNNMYLKPNLHILAEIKNKGDIPLYVFYKFHMSQEKVEEKLAIKHDTKSFIVQFSMDDICKYIDPERFNKPYIRHINGNLLDNRLENLEPSDEREKMTRDMLIRYTSLMDIEYDKVDERTVMNMVRNGTLKENMELNPEVAKLAQEMFSGLNEYF